MNAHANVPQGPEADARRTARVFEERQPAWYTEEYKDPNEISNEFKTFNHTVVREIRNLENDLREVVVQAKAPGYTIRFEDADSIGARHSKWASLFERPDSIDEMTTKEKAKMLKIANDEVRFLRKETTRLQRTMLDREKERARLEKRGESLERLNYTVGSRPVDQ